MKKIYLTFVSLVVCFFFFSCQNDEEYSVLTTTSPSTEGKINEELENSKIENNAYKLASVLHNAITTKDNSFLKLLQKETKKKFDGDYDFLVSNFRQGTTRSSNDIERLYQSLLVPQNIDKSLYSRAHRAVTQSFLDNLLDSISKSEPLLNIYMPDWGDLSQYDDFLIVISPKEVNEHEEYTLKAYNMKGDTILLSSKKEPDLPYLVIGYNERVNVKTKMENSSSTFLRTPYYSYELKTEGLISSESLQITNNNNAKLENTNASIRKRSIIDRKSFETIKKARFLSKSALQNVEGWSRGAPEMFCKVYYKKLGSLFDFIVGEVSVFPINLGEDGWYSGSRSWLKFKPWKVVENNGNWRVFNWARTALMTKMAYLFYEDDGEAKVTVSAFGKEVEATVSSGDLVGSSWVYFSDSLNKSYKISNSFEFTIDQEM